MLTGAAAIPVSPSVLMISSAISNETPYTGLGKPEPLKHDLTGYWSRRITKEDRLVYRVEGGVIYIAQRRLHYDKR